MEREVCDLSHASLHALDIGRLIGLARIPVIAGDSFEMKSNFLFRLAQLRRPMVADIKMDVFAFFCPYRYTYSDWVSYIESGTKEAFTFPLVGASDRPHHWLLHGGGLMPKHLWADAVNIWNFYFRDPSWAEMSPDTVVQDLQLRRRGPKVAHLKSWGTAQAFRADLTDTEFKVDTSQPSISMFDIQTQVAKGRSKQFRDFMSSRYVEILEQFSGVAPSDYSDNRPELVWQESQWMSGYDINGSSGAELGSSVGKAIGNVNFNMPRRLFTEHGTMYIFAVLRIPPLFRETKQYLDDMNRPFLHVVPQADINIPPVQMTMADYFVGGSTASMGYVPAYDWYRSHPSFVHWEMYEEDTGWQYLPAPSSPSAAVEVGNYDSMFQTLKNRHAIASCRHDITAWRPLPSQRGSIMGSF